jgi:hypothetical protein
MVVCTGIMGSSHTPYGKSKNPFHFRTFCVFALGLGDNCGSLARATPAVRYKGLIFWGDWNPSPLGVKTYIDLCRLIQTETYIDSLMERSTASEIYGPLARATLWWNPKIN